MLQNGYGAYETEEETAFASCLFWPMTASIGGNQEGNGTRVERQKGEEKLIL